MIENEDYNSGKISWDEYFLNMASLVATRSTCARRSVGAVIVSETHNVISTGYNGAPRGLEHCGPKCAKREPGTNYEDCAAIHGEINAIVNAAFNGVSTKDSTLYLTCTPCILCARVIINAGISRVVCRELYNNATISQPGLEILKRGRVSVVVGNVTEPEYDNLINLNEYWVKRFIEVR